MDDFFQRIQDPSYKGLILDLRNNYGGSAYDLDFFASRFIQKPYTAFHSKMKNGPNRHDFSPWKPYDILPYPQVKSPNFPIVILVNKGSISMAEVTTAVLSHQSNVIVVGENTFGAFGTYAGNPPPTNPFTTDEGATIYVNHFTVGKGPLSITVKGAYINTKFSGYKRYEGKGFPPDEPVKLDPSKALSKNRLGDIEDISQDTQLDRAIEIIQEKSKP